MSLQTILQKIAAITDAGKNTAFEMRSLLTDMLTTLSGATTPITNTSELTNDGEDGINSFVGVNDIQNSIVGTYSEIKSLRDNNELIPGFRYVINDYQTQYFIEGSNSSGIVAEREIVDNISTYAVLDVGIDTRLVAGVVVEITELPDGYAGPLTTGDTTTVTTNFSDFYFFFANGMQSVIGLKFRYFLERYQSVAQDAVITDLSGNTVMQPQGLINTDVHNGQPYMDMTTSENPIVPIEQITLIASTFNDFEEVGFSNTYVGDEVFYNMDNTDIINDNNEVIGTRKGYVFKRVNNDIDIEIPIDWRVYRFRRWLLEPESRLQLINEDIDLSLSARTYANGQYLFSSNNRTTGDTESFYLSLTPEQDFNNLDENAMVKDFSITANTISAKDYFVIPLDSNYNPLVVRFICSFFLNTVFQNVSGGEFNIGINVSTKGGFINSTMVGGVSLNSPTNFNIYNSVFLDATFLGSGTNITFDNVVALSTFQMENATQSNVTNSVFGTLNNNINNMGSQIGWNIIESLNNSFINRTAFGSRAGYLQITNSRIVLSSIFNGYSLSTSTEDSLNKRELMIINSSVMSRVGLRLLARIDRISFNDMLFPDLNPDVGTNFFFYDFTTNQERKEFNLNRYNFNLYRLDIDINDQITIVNEAQYIT